MKLVRPLVNSQSQPKQAIIAMGAKHAFSIYYRDSDRISLDALDKKASYRVGIGPRTLLMHWIGKNATDDVLIPLRSFHRGIHRKALGVYT